MPSNETELVDTILKSNCGTTILITSSNKEFELGETREINKINDAFDRNVGIMSQANESAQSPPKSPTTSTIGEYLFEVNEFRIPWDFIFPIRTQQNQRQFSTWKNDWCGIVWKS